MTNQQSSLRDVFDELEREGLVSKEELESILNAVSVIKRESGWGSVEIVIKASDLKDVRVMITYKEDKQHTDK